MFLRQKAESEAQNMVFTILRAAGFYNSESPLGVAFVVNSELHRSGSLSSFVFGANKAAPLYFYRVGFSSYGSVAALPALAYCNGHVANAALRDRTHPHPARFAGRP
jgi:hypothetical protein